MANRQIRLSRPDFTTVSRDTSAKRATSTHFSVTYSLSGVGFAVVVSKKVAKSSVQRHLLKRRVREAIRPFAGSSSALIVYARAGASALSYAEIVEELSTLLRRFGS